MPKITVRKCPFTGKIFEDESKYRKHLATIRSQNRTRWILDRDNADDDAWWAQARELEMGFDELQKFIIENQDRFWKDAAKSDSHRFQEVGRANRRGKVMPMPKLASFKEFSLRWSDSVSNTHSHPRDGIENWGCKPDLPRGYPGWHGRVSWLIEWPEEFDGWYPGGDLFSGSRTGMHTGTGGGGGYSKGHQSFAYDFKIFAADWPGLARWFEKNEMWKALNQR